MTQFPGGTFGIIKKLCCCVQPEPCFKVAELCPGQDDPPPGILPPCFPCSQITQESTFQYETRCWFVNTDSQEVPECEGVVLDINTVPLVEDCNDPKCLPPMCWKMAEPCGCDDDPPELPPPPWVPCESVTAEIVFQYQDICWRVDPNSPETNVQPTPVVDPGLQFECCFFADCGNQACCECDNCTDFCNAFGCDLPDTIVAEVSGTNINEFLCGGPGCKICFPVLITLERPAGSCSCLWTATTLVDSSGLSGTLENCPCGLTGQAIFRCGGPLTDQWEFSFLYRPLNEISTPNPCDECPSDTEFVVEGGSPCSFPPGTLNTLVGSFPSCVGGPSVTILQ